jgi:hypothetical protein
VGALEDPIFDPWSAGYPEEPAPAQAEASPTAETEQPAAGPGQPSTTPVALPRLQVATGLPEPLESLRRLATARLEALARRLKLARHRTSLEDLLDGPARLIRFQLRPGRSPLSSAPTTRPAVLEIGVDAASEGLLTAWCWLDDLGEAPYRTVSVPAEMLSAGWIDRVALDFVARALERD